MVSSGEKDTLFGMGNTISEALEPNDLWWPQETQIQTRVIQPESSACATILKNTSLISTDIVQTETENTSSLDREICESSHIELNNDEHVHRNLNEEKMEQFRSELAKKHLARRQAIAERSKEILFLREELAKQKKDNEELRELSNMKETCPETPATADTSWREEIDKLTKDNEHLKNALAEQQEQLVKYQEVQQQNHELRLNIAEVQEELQSANSQVVSFEKERYDYQTHVTAMKEVVKVSKQLLEIRENQLQELRTKVTEIESNLAEQETSMLATNLRNEYEKQLRNMRALRTLYEQRQAATKADRDSIANQLADATKQLETEQSKIKEHQERIEELEQVVSDKYDKVQSLESQLGLSKAECRGLQAEMLVINQLFSQILVGFNNGQVDLDKLIKLLEENHDLLTDIVINEESVEHISALPKTLLDLVNQVHSQARQDSTEQEEPQSGSELVVDDAQCELAQQEQQASSSQMCSAAEIVHNLPKVWRVLAELLSQQSGQQPVVITDDGMDPCYKSVETPKGPKIVLSVSQTFIRLKDLILEKKSLEKDMTRLKQLNTHLEVRLQDQEKRLETVSTELSKTWHVVGRMQRQHQQLHTHEKILRYELAQKRKMLTELKQELEYCREKWEQAREKNSNTEEQWKKLRSEFASRKTATADDLNNSAESGYSDERECSSDEDSSYGSKQSQVVIPSPQKASSDAEDNDETSHNSDGDDLLETAFSKACSADTLQKPNLTLSAVYVLNAESTEASSSTCGHFNIVNNHETETLDCDNPLVNRGTNDNSEEGVGIDSTVHSTQQSETDDSEVVVTNDRQTQEQTIQVTTEENSSASSHDEPPEPANTESLRLEADILTAEDEIESSQTSICDTVAPSSSQQTGPVQRTSEEILSKREERLKRLEEQCQQLVQKVTNTTNRGMEINSRLETLHEQYGSATDPSPQCHVVQNHSDSQGNDENSTADVPQNDASAVESNTRQTDHDDTLNNT